MKFSNFLFLLIFVLVDTVRSQDKTCHKDILTSYNLFGLSTPEEISLEMCPEIKESCCSKEDQLTIYNNWRHHKEGHRIKKHYHKIALQYNSLLHEFEQVQGMAEKTIQILEYKKIANCKVMAQRILNFDIKGIKDALIDNTKKMTDFLYDSYKGFYCSICNYENHQFFNKAQQTIQFSEKFCRDIVENTLSNLLFFHVNINKYANLVSRYLLSCDKKGDFEENVVLPKSTIFVNDEIIEKNLERCREERNSNTWFVYCKPICEHYQISSYVDYFTPQLKKLENYRKFIRQQIIKISHGGKGDAGIFATEKKTRRLLEAVSKNKKLTKKKSKKSKKTKKSKKHRKLVVDPDARPSAQQKTDSLFDSGLQTKINLHHFKSTFGILGLAPFDSGRNTLISSSMYNQVKTLIQIEKSKKNAAENVEEQPVEPVQRRMLINNGITKMIVELTFILITFVIQL